MRTRDLADLTSLGVRAQPVRRFYPGSSASPRASPACARRAPRRRSAGASVAVLDSGVDARTRCWPAGSIPATTPSTATATRRRRATRAAAGARASGTALAGVLAAAGERVLPIRVAGLQPATSGAGLEEVATSDQLLAGLERAVDPDGDGATDDHVPVALVGVNSPYAGFAHSPEARAVRAAAALGTLVVAAGRQRGRGGRAGGHDRLAGRRAATR